MRLIEISEPFAFWAGDSLYDNAFNKIEKDLRAEEGIGNKLDYVEQTSCILFLKYLHDLETERKDRADLDGDDYTPIINGVSRGLCCTNFMRDFSRETGVVAGRHEQTDTPDLQDPELVALQQGAEAPGRAVRSGSTPT